MLGNLHPELLPRLAAERLVGVLSRQLNVFGFQCDLDSLGVQSEDAIEDYLSLFDVIYFLSVALHEHATNWSLGSLLIKHVYLSLANIDRIVHLKENGLPLSLVSLLLLEVFDQFI